MTIARKLVLGFSVTTVLLFFSSAVSVYFLGVAVDAMVELEEHVRLVDEIDSVGRAVRNLRGPLEAVQHPSDVDHEEKKWMGYRADLNQALGNAKNSEALDAGWRRRLEQVERDVDSASKYAKVIFTLAREAEGRSNGEGGDYVSMAAELYAPVSDELGRIEEEVRGRIVDDLGIRDRFSLPRGFLLGVCAFALLFAVVAATLTTRSIVIPLQHLADATDRLGAGDLTRRVPVESKDEIGRLAEAFNGMAEGLESLVQEMRTSALEVQSSAAEIRRQIEKQAIASSQQAASVTETTATMEELAHTSRQIAENAESVSSIAQRTHVLSRNGVDASGETVRGMDEIRERYETSTSEIRELRDKSERIGSVMRIINDIADQTKLIAFNAALEAAGAGDAGKRFSVVAAEVRRLAENVVESTSEIETLIREIQDTSHRLMGLSEEGTGRIREGFDRVEKSGSYLQEIHDGANDTAKSSQLISLATQQLRTASEQMVGSLREISGGADHFAGTSRGIRDVVQSLGQLADGLAAHMAQFRVEDSTVNGAAEDQEPA